MGDENKKPDTPPEPQSGFPQKKIVFAFIAIAIILLAVVLIAKFSFNVDLLNPASGEMSLVQRQAIGIPVASIIGVTTSVALSQTEPEGTEDYNLQYLMLQDNMQKENRQYSTVSSMNKTANDTAKNAINNVR
jgi:hypothetical protein